jgi:transposase-like protein/IS1 family transposase
MNPHQICCPIADCPARGQLDKGNIKIHDRKKRRYRCVVCSHAFSETKGTPFYRLHKERELFTLIVKLLARGCPRQAIVFAFGLDERTVADWEARAGLQCQKVQEHLVEQGRELGEVQCDELRVKCRRASVVWMAFAIQVATRLWLGGAVAQQRDEGLIRRLLEQVKRCALCRPMLFCTDGLKTYVSAIREVFREADRASERGRPRLLPWPQIYIVQVVKQYAGGWVLGVQRRIVQGTAEQIEAARHKASAGGVFNTAFIERINATFRGHVAALCRRTRALALRSQTLHQAMYLTGAIYNFCAEHASLRLPGLIGGHKYLGRTPAMAAGITDHCWTVEELLSHRVPLPRWEPPKKRGRRSREMLALIRQWAL